MTQSKISSIVMIPSASVDDSAESAELFYVVFNSEEQYSIWPAWRDLPLGWEVVGESSARDVCLDWIEKNWNDMRPLSVRRFLEEQAQSEHS